MVYPNWAGKGFVWDSTHFLLHKRGLSSHLRRTLMGFLSTLMLVPCFVDLQHDTTINK